MQDVVCSPLLAYARMMWQLVNGCTSAACGEDMLPEAHAIQ